MYAFCFASADFHHGGSATEPSGRGPGDSATEPRGRGPHVFGFVEGLHVPPEDALEYEDITWAEDEGMLQDEGAFGDGDGRTSLEDDGTHEDGFASLECCGIW